MSSSPVIDLRSSPTEWGDTQEVRSLQRSWRALFLQHLQANRLMNSKRRCVRRTGRFGNELPAQPGMEGMGTTVCAVGLLSSGHLAIVNVGDSRAYLFRQGSLSHLTRDHSLTAELIEHGELKEWEAAQHPYYGILTRALGVGSDVAIDRTTLTVEEGDRIVVCSDGLFNELTDEEIETALAGNEDLIETVDTLVEGAITKGGRDNISVVIAEVAA